MIEEGQALVVNMNTDYGMNPSPKCYTCMVDPFEHACRKWANVNVNGWAFERAIKVEKGVRPAHAIGHVCKVWCYI